MRLIVSALAFVGVATLSAAAAPASAHTVALNPLAGPSISWAFEWERKDLEGVLALYTDDAVFMDATGARITGKPALRKFFATVLQQYTAHPTMHSVAAYSAGDLGYEWGDYSEVVVPVAKPDAAIKAQGTYLVILRKVGGHWLIANQMWTGNVPVPVKR
jgi:uncharacterized protein (TIGR02246 family)